MSDDAIRAALAEALPHHPWCHERDPPGPPAPGPDRPAPSPHRTEQSRGTASIMKTTRPASGPLPVAPHIEQAAWEHVASGDLDRWFGAAHDHPDPAIRDAGGEALAALLRLRVAMDELSRAQRAE